jgi:hypothetical protein
MSVRRLLMVLVPFVLLSVASPIWSYAASCKGDRKVDSPMQFSVVAESAGRVHLSAFGGSDRSGWIDVGTLGMGAWTIFDGSGRKLDLFLPSPLVFASLHMLWETNLEGLIPGASYTIQLASMDACSNLAYVRQSITMPESTPENVSPLASTPEIVWTGFLGSSSTVLHFSATDDTGIQRVAIYFNGSLLKEYHYFDNVAFRWWADPYDGDVSQSTLEGPNYYVSYPDTFRGQSGLVEVVVEDFFGNTTTSSAELGL